MKQCAFCNIGLLQIATEYRVAQDKVDNTRKRVLRIAKRGLGLTVDFPTHYVSV